ncbi:MAG: PAS domain-containing protein, partial [Firmicutes bacterium]|nr:PAS domain-containing protein [Bacillota bacterium]
EKLILFPVANHLLTQQEKRQLFEESKAYGYVFMDNLPITKDTTTDHLIENGFIQTMTGKLSMEQFDGVMKYIPVDITFVDQEDKVRFFNNRKERHFPRNPSIIGRLVKHCHPPKSVYVVEQIINSFKDGSRDEEEFWITFNNLFLYITYYAVRSKDGGYLGTLEVSQDVTHIRSLTGQKRLLDEK